VREVIRIRHYSIRTEQAYVQWIRRFVLFHGKRHPREMACAGAHGVSELSRCPAQRRCVDAESGVARILFLCRDVLKINLPWLDEVQRAKKPQRLPFVQMLAAVRAPAKRVGRSEG
jgi:Phage integrase, N-terminal SAM-like domain